MLILVINLPNIIKSFGGDFDDQEQYLVYNDTSKDIKKYLVDFETEELSFEFSDDKFGAKYDRDSQKLPKSLFYNTKDKKYVINVIGYASLLAEKTMYIKMSGMLQKEEPVNGKKNSIVNLRLDWLGLPRNQFEEISEIVEDTTVMMINDYLEDLFVNKVVFLTKKDRTELIETINLIDYHNSCKSKNIIKYVQNIETLNKYIRDTLELPYEIKCFETSRMIEGKKMKYKNAWKVVKIIG